MAGLWLEVYRDVRAHLTLRGTARNMRLAFGGESTFPRPLVALVSHRLAARINLYRRARGRTALSALLQSYAGALRLLSILWGRCEILPSCTIGSGVFLGEEGNDFIGALRIGTGTRIGSRVTLGIGLTNRGRPRIGERVWIGDDCVAFGDIEIGDGSALLPGTVLTRSVPPRTLVHGNPARVLRTDFDNSELLAHADCSELIARLTEE